MVFSPGVQFQADLIGVRLHVLEGLEDAERLVDVATHGQVVDGGVHDHTIRVNDEQATQCMASSSRTL